ncbi:hypothetical protein ES288_D11G401700v1 [Gossypium darwinii]|uniref:Uncharacterized protein n=1 Tax=Gossypium darwinii TaxID=34276 RepID=A0A5D2AXJ0_GOSDA|nr:hypothetical protein ES288_D11G401700v1 [Gossypium darwinii]
MEFWGAEVKSGQSFEVELEDDGSRILHISQNEVYDDDNNNKVEFKDFRSLEQALNNTAWGKFPDYLEPIAICIENV